MKDSELKKSKKKKLEKFKGEVDYPHGPIQLNDKTFTETVQKYPLVVVDFWTAWCGPCHMIAPVVEELAKEYSGKIVFGKLNVDENRAMAVNFGVMSVPTMLIFKNGKAVDKIIGAVPREAIETKLKQYLKV